MKRIWLLALVIASTTGAMAADPKVPPGQDPGGVAIAIIGDGVDYTQPELARRVARDGEGVLIGFDFVDDDAFPYGTGNGTDLASFVLKTAPGTRLAIVRSSTSDALGLARAAVFVAKSPAKIAVVAGADWDALAWQPFQQVVEKMPDILFLIDAGAAPKLPDIENVLVTAAGVSVAAGAADAALLHASDRSLSGAALKQRLNAASGAR